MTEKGVTGVKKFPKYMSISFLKMNVNIQIVFYKYNNIYHQCLTFCLQSFIIWIVERQKNKALRKEKVNIMSHTYFNTTNLEIPRTGRKVPNQFVTEIDNKVYFQSYQSLIAVIDNKEKTIILTPDWNYSNTTAKYRNEFFKAYGLWNEMETTKGVQKAINDGKVGNYKVIYDKDRQLY